MLENPHEKEALPPKDENLSEEPDEKRERSAWSDDQKMRSYYYDDACGYETYDPDEDERDEDEAAGRNP